MFQIAKIDSEQNIVFGFANVSVSKATSSGKGGDEFFDLQQDSIPPEELEKAAYDHVLEFREADAMHKGPAIGRLVESMVFTPDKLQKFVTDPVSGEIDYDSLKVLQKVFPPRWWVGYKLDDPDTIKKVKSGKYKMFSIAGEADRVEV